MIKPLGNRYHLLDDILLEYVNGLEPSKVVDERHGIKQDLRHISIGNRVTEAHAQILLCQGIVQYSSKNKTDVKITLQTEDVFHLTIETFALIHAQARDSIRPELITKPLKGLVHNWVDNYLNLSGG